MSRKTLYIFCWISLMSILFSSCLSTEDENIIFTDVTEQAGIGFLYTFGDFTYENILESSGSGVTIFDYDGDGYMDLYMLNGTYLEGISDPEGEIFKDTPNQLYRNNGNGTFTEVAKEACINDRHWSMAAGAIDYDNDGDEDLYLLNYGPNVFYLNNGDGTFSDITDSIGLRGPEKLNGFIKWSVGVAFWDYDLDGNLDAMVGNFLAFDPEYISPTTPDMMTHASEYKGQASMLYKQQSNGLFVDVTAKHDLYFPDSKCMGLTVYDYDDDGDLDLFQGNDHQLNFLFRNDDGIFNEVAVESGVAANSRGLPTGSMHGSIGDIDGDGLIDLLVVDLRYGALYRNIGNGLFEDITEESGVAGAFAGKGEWAAALFDYDNDGDLDIFSANGTAEELILQHPLLLENDGKGNFKNVGHERCAYFSDKRSGRTAAIWDYDNDGDLDIIVSHVDLQATAALLRNDGGNRNHWLGLKLLGKDGPASAIGAKVIIHSGDKKQVLINQWATSYLSYNDPRLHIGLGQQKHVDRVEIIWSDGNREIYHDPDIDCYITILQGTGILSNLIN
ncbi:MAG: CRTAC1 family protein [Bacteroidales bacterium]|nr:CRTAC1 family protein [Bacteroidales bacterium]